MSALFASGKLFVVYNPQQKKYLSKRRRGDNYSNWSWTDQLEWVHFYRTEAAADAACGEGCEIIAASLTMTGVTSHALADRRAFEFDNNIGRFIELHKKPKLSSQEDNEYGRIRKRLRRLDVDRYETTLASLSQ